MEKLYKVIVVDDHQLVRKGFVELINSFDGFRVIYDVNNGKELVGILKNYAVPDLIVLDIDMPEMDGYETAEYLTKFYPSIKVLAISVIDDKFCIKKMIESGADGYILKDSNPNELYQAMEDVLTKGMYPSILVQSALIEGGKCLGRGIGEGKFELNTNQKTFI